MDTTAVPAVAAALAGSVLVAAGGAELPIPSEWVVQGGAVGLLVLVALMIYRGALVPRRTYEELKLDRDYWRAVALKAIGQADALLPAAHITTEMAKKLSDAAATEQVFAGSTERGGPG